MRAWLIGLAAVMGIVEAAKAGAIDDGLAAFDRRDYDTAVKLLQPLAEGGDPQAEVHLGDVFANGSVSIPRNDAEAAKWFRKAAEQGDPAGQKNLAAAYFAGRGLPKDDAEGARWYRTAADSGDEAAQSMMGLLYREGFGVPRDYVQAYMWFDLAAGRGGDFASTDAAKRDAVAQAMTSDQIAEAQRLAREWKPRTAP